MFNTDKLKKGSQGTLFYGTDDLHVQRNPRIFNNNSPKDTILEVSLVHPISI